MDKNRFAVVSKWMANWKINQFVTAHSHVNWFELVSYPFKFLTPSFVADNYATLAVSREMSRGVIDFIYQG